MEKRHIKLIDTDRSQLEVMLSNRSLTVKIYKRVESLLALDSGLTFRIVIKQVGLSFPTLKTLCERYKEQGLACLKDAPKSGRPIQISGEERAKITALACSKAPEGYAKWTLRLLADKVMELGICEHLSHVHAGEILKKMNYNRTSNANGASGL
jgi:putative transposase